MLPQWIKSHHWQEFNMLPGGVDGEAKPFFLPYRTFPSLLFLSVDLFSQLPILHRHEFTWHAAKCHSLQQTPQTSDSFPCENAMAKRKGGDNTGKYLHQSTGDIIYGMLQLADAPVNASSFHLPMAETAVFFLDLWPRSHNITTQQCANLCT